MNLEQTCTDVIDLCKQVGKYLEANVNQLSDDMITVKAHMDFVTQIDKEAERLLVDGLSLILPEAGYIAEEDTSTKVGDRFDWIIDPLDGTTNFIHGVIPFCISIALKDKDELVLGVIYDPLQKECFYAWNSGGAWLNGNPIKVSSKLKLNESLIATGFPYTDFSLIDEYMNSLRDFMTKTHGVRRLGSAAMDLAYVACGRFEAFYEYHLKPWDVAAGTVLIKEAGGTVCDFHARPNYLFGESYVGTNGVIHNEFMEIIQAHFK